MDKKFNDIHYVMQKDNKKRLFVIRQVQILYIIFDNDTIRITYIDENQKTLIIPKLSYCKLTID